MRTAFVAVVVLTLVLGVSAVQAATTGQLARATGGDVGTVAPAGTVLSSSASDVRAAASVTLVRVSATPSLTDLSWTTSTAPVFSSYELEYSTAGPTGPWTLESNQTSSADNSTWVYGLTPGASYWWFETTWTFLLGYDSATSNVLAVVQPTDAYLTATTPSPTSVDLNWTNNATYGGDLSFDNYTVYQSTSGGPSSPITSIGSGATRTYLVTGLTAGTGYGFYVATWDKGSSSVATDSYDTDSNTVNVGTPQSLEVVASAEPTSADANQTVEFQCVAIGGVTPYTYAWTFGDGGVATGASPAHAYAAASDYTAHCTVTDATHATQSGPALVDVSPSPSVVASVDHLDAAPGTSLSFSAVAHGGPGAFASYEWNFGDGQIASGASGTFEYPNSGAYRVSVTVTDANGGVAQSSLGVNITNIDISASSGATVGVPQTDFAFSGTANGGGGAPFNFTWHFGDGTVGYGAATSHLYASASTYDPFVIVTDSIGGVQQEELPAITVDADLATNVVVGTSQPTVGQSVTLTADSTGGAGTYSCSWNFGDGTNATGCAVDHTWSEPGQYNVTVSVQDPVGGNLTTNRTVDVTSASTGATGSGSSSAASFLGLPFWAWAALIVAALVLVGLALFAMSRRSGGRPADAPGHQPCPHCGSAVPARALLCPKCGKPTRAVSTLPKGKAT
jgi:PKD repeat protein